MSANRSLITVVNSHNSEYNLYSKMSVRRSLVYSWEVLFTFVDER